MNLIRDKRLLVSGGQAFHDDSTNTLKYTYKENISRDIIIAWIIFYNTKPFIQFKQPTENSLITYTWMNGFTFCSNPLPIYLVAVTECLIQKCFTQSS